MPMMRKLLPLLLSPLVWADSSLQAGLQQCARLGEGSARLACYDALAVRPLAANPADAQPLPTQRPGMNKPLFAPQTGACC